MEPAPRAALTRRLARTASAAPRHPPPPFLRRLSPRACCAQTKEKKKAKKAKKAKTGKPKSVTFGAKRSGVKAPRVRPKCAAHGKQLSYCFPCKRAGVPGAGNSLCRHGQRLTSSCPDCGVVKAPQVRRKCAAHGKQLSRCFPCKRAGVDGAGTELCEHGKLLSSSCDEC